MAGSWQHLTTKGGRFRGTELLDNMGDAAEALEEAYGMVWWLASQLQATDNRAGRLGYSTRGYIKEANEHYKDGLRLSPGMTNSAKAQGLRWDQE